MDELKINDVTKFIKNQINNNRPDIKFSYENEHNKSDPDYHLRFICMQGWFLRCSFKTKLYFLKELAYYLKDINTLLTLLNILYTVSCKDRNYSMIRGEFYTPDLKLINSDNRCLNNKVLNKVMANEINWYSKLNDVEQFSIILDLLELSECSIIMGSIFDQFLEVFKLRLFLSKPVEIIPESNPLNTEAEKVPPQYVSKVNTEENIKQVSKANTEENIKYVSMVNTEENIKFASKANTEENSRNFLKENTEENIRNVSFEDLEKIDLIKKNLNDFLPPYDPKDPLNIEFQKLIKKYDEFILKYKKQLGLYVPPPKSAKSKDSKKSKKSKDGKKDKKQDKKSEKKDKKKDKKKGKKDKKGKKKEKNFLDVIQVNPLWTNLAIISRLTTKELNLLKSLNDYWKFGLKEIKADNKARKMLDKAIEKLESTLLEKGEIEVINKIKKEFIFKRSDITKPSLRRMLRNRKVTTQSVLNEVYKEHLVELSQFPRSRIINNIDNNNKSCTPFSF